MNILGFYYRKGLRRAYVLAPHKSFELVFIIVAFAVFIIFLNLP